MGFLKTALRLQYSSGTEDKSGGAVVEPSSGARGDWVERKQWERQCVLQEMTCPVTQSICGLWVLSQVRGGKKSREVRWTRGDYLKRAG